ncbi:SHOCT domain-containing protein [Roseivivax isoporae]|uniref:SHOCT domain-containing protein n=1 Tax=Roseivivax isoporae LMG 25204 TaxID=1449351 RepID=X7F9A0_9RHOB|nr:SHOCT domain-containing protein [Roseivivax isoporae]ETX29380.1 hypothetical protein RISW2_01535 [Roseivivax isoporae LMG 25204]
MTLTTQGEDLASRLAERHGTSVDAVRTLIAAVVAGNGRQAQFSHPDLGGMGQWSSGGMTMVGDMFNTRLQALVAALCADIAQAAGDASLVARPAPGSGGTGQSRSGAWWPETLGIPTSTGSQNDTAYAVFPDSRRLATRIGGRVTVHDTRDHVIGGVGQQQSGGADMTFTSQFGIVRLRDLPVVSGEEAKATESPSDAGRPETGGTDDVFAALEKLGALRDKGILSEEEFARKKAELLARI